MDITIAGKLAVDLIEEHLPSEGWRFKFDNGKLRFGHTKYAPRTISVSRPLTLLNNEDAVRRIILHEIAHAKVGLGHGHDRVWKQAARAIGADPTRTYDEWDVDVVPTEAPYVGTCPNCGHQLRRHRMGKNMRTGGIACSRCCNRFNRGRFSRDYAYQWTRGVDKPSVGMVN